MFLVTFIAVECLKDMLAPVINYIIAGINRHSLLSFFLFTYKKEIGKNVVLIFLNNTFFNPLSTIQVPLKDLLLQRVHKWCQVASHRFPYHQYSKNNPQLGHRS